MLGVVGAIVIWVIGVKNVSDTVDNFARYRAPGARVLTFNSPGTFTIYYEGSDNRDDVPGLDITVVDASGNEVPIQTGDIPDVSFSVNGHAGVAVAKVKIPAAGKYTIDVESSDASGDFNVAVGKGVLGKLAQYILAGIGVGFVGVVLGVVTLIVTGVKRGRRKREAAAALAPAGQWGMAPAPAPMAWNSPPVSPPTAPLGAPPPWTTPPGPATPPPPPPPGGGMPPPPPPPPPN